MSAPTQGVPFGRTAISTRRTVTWVVAICVVLAGMAVLGVAITGIWVARQIDSTDASLYHHEMCVLSGDNRTAVFAAGSGPNEALWACDLASRRSRQLTAARGLVFALELSPDQSTIAYVRRVDGSWSVSLLPLSGGRPRVTPLPSAELVRQLAWAADGRAVYLVNASGRAWRDDSATSICRVDVQTGSLTTLLEHVGPVSELHLQRTGRYEGWLRWIVQPDYLRGRVRQVETCTVMNPATRQTQVANSDEAPYYTSDDGAFVLHQQPDYAAMEASHWQDGAVVPKRLWVADAAGHATTPVWHARAGGTSESWPTGDGKAILVTRYDGGPAWHVERVNPADGSATVLLDRELLHHPTTWRGPVTPAR